jgi:hypothetical protein
MLAGRYHDLLKTFGEVSSGSLTILGREWFCVTSPDSVTVHVYFLVEECPEEHALVHGDFGSNNVLTEANGTQV